MFAAPAAAAPRPKGAPIPRLPASPTQPRETYEVRRIGLPVVFLTRGVLCCFFDLSLKQAALALGVCITTMKKIRIWSGFGAWPNRDVRFGRHPQFTTHSVEALRVGLIDTLQRMGDLILRPVLVRAQALSLGIAVEPLSPPPPPQLPDPVPIPLEGLDLDLSGLDLPDFEDAEALLDEWRPLPVKGAPRGEPE